MMNTPAVQALAERWANELDAVEAAAPASWVASLRERARAEFRASGLPHRKVEDWKYTPVRLLAESAPRLGRAGSGSGRYAEPLVDGAARLDLAGDSVDGAFPELPGGATVCYLRDIPEELEPQVRGLLEGVEISGPGRAFAALNTVFLDQALVIHVPESVDAGRLLVRWGATGDIDPAFSQARILLLLEKGSRLEMIEQFDSGADGALNVMLQAVLADGADWRHVRLQNETDQSVLFTSTSVEQAADSRYTCNSFDLGGGLVRHEVDTVLAGPGAHADLGGAFVLDERRHVDNHISVDHAAPDCSSEQFFRGVLGGRSRGVFNGRALIRAGADGSSVVQSNANLLLSWLAEIDTKPELEIYADEVEASHGATVGQLDESAVFYLRSRGLSDEAARRMLTAAFCHAVSDRLDDRELANKVAAMLDDAMPEGE